MGIHCVVNESLTAALTLQPIDNLIVAARDGFRLYELFRLNGPADLIHYVDIEVVADAPEALSWWPQGMYDEERPQRWRTDLESPPWTLFGGDSSEIQSAWARSGADAVAPGMAAARWPEIEAARAAARSSSEPFIVFELALIDACEHPNDLLLREAETSNQVCRHFRQQPERRFSADLYRLVEDLLGQPEITAYTQRGRGDLHLLKLACREQFRRGGTLSMFDDNPFPIRILGRTGGPSYHPDDDYLVALDPYPAWTRQVRWQFEGLEAQGLFFDEGGYGGMTYGEMEQFEPRRGIGAIIATYPDPLASSERDWTHREDGVIVGLSPHQHPIRES